MQTVVETITPEKAMEYLKTSIGNRPISKTMVRSYADSMKKGRWAENGVTIIFDNEGHLLDGHHRMHAVVLAGIPVKFLVCRGVSHEVFITIDQGRNKNLGQLLAMQSVENYNCVAAVVGGNITLIGTGRLYNVNSAKHRRSTNAEFYDEYCKDPEGYEEAAGFALEIYRKERLIKPSWVGAIYYYLHHTGGYDKEFIKLFFKETSSLDTSKVKAADELRKFLIRNTRTGTMLKPEHLLAAIYKAWNYYVKGGIWKTLKYEPENEQFPTLELNTEGRLI